MAARPLGDTIGLVLIAPDLVASEPASVGLRRLLAALLVGVVVAIGDRILGRPPGHPTAASGSRDG